MDESGVPLSPGGQKAQKLKLKTKINPVLLAIPATFDICGSTLMFIALTMCAVSVYQMMRGIIVFITAGLAVTLLGEKRYIHHWLALTLIVAGVAVVGVVSVSDSQSTDDDSDATPTKAAGVLLLLAA